MAQSVLAAASLFMRRALFPATILAAHALAVSPALADDEPVSLATPRPAADASGRGHIDWLVRLQLGMRTVTPSPQQDLLNLDGYGASPRFVFSGEFGRLLTPVVAVSGWTDFSLRSSNHDQGGPKMNEDVWMLGAGVPLIPVGWETTALMIVPRVGYGWSWMSIGGHAEPVGALVYGGDLVVLWPRAHVNVGFGWLNAPTRPPGETGRRSNFGGLGLLVGGVLDG
jgi:hypothetical protein